MLFRKNRSLLTDGDYQMDMNLTRILKGKRKYRVFSCVHETWHFIFGGDFFNQSLNHMQFSQSLSPARV